MRFKPWVGSQFETGLGGSRILIVGEAHHGPPEQNAETDFTTRCIRQVICGAWKLKFFNNLPSLFSGLSLGVDRPHSAAFREQFWNRVSFYNFVQEMIAGPGVAPTEAAWDRGHEPLVTVFQELRPQTVLFVCKRLYSVVAPRYDRAGTIALGTANRNTILIPAGTERAVGSFILHPTYRGYRKQRAWVAELLRHSSEVRQPVRIPR